MLFFPCQCTRNWSGKSAYECRTTGELPCGHRVTFFSTLWRQLFPARGFALTVSNDGRVFPRDNHSVFFVSVWSSCSYRRFFRGERLVSTRKSLPCFSGGICSYCSYRRSPAGTIRPGGTWIGSSTAVSQATAASVAEVGTSASQADGKQAATTDFSCSSNEYGADNDGAKCLYESSYRIPRDGWSMQAYTEEAVDQGSPFREEPYWNIRIAPDAKYSRGSSGWESWWIPGATHRNALFIHPVPKDFLMARLWPQPEIRGSLSAYRVAYVLDAFCVQRTKERTGLPPWMILHCCFQE